MARFVVGDDRRNIESIDRCFPCAIRILRCDPEMRVTDFAVGALETKHAGALSLQPHDVERLIHIGNLETLARQALIDIDGLSIVVHCNVPVRQLFAPDDFALIVAKIDEIARSAV